MKFNMKQPVEHDRKAVPRTTSMPWTSSPKLCVSGRAGSSTPTSNEPKKMKERSMGINPNDEFFVNPNSRQARRKNGKPKGEEVVRKLDINVLRDVAQVPDRSIEATSRSSLSYTTGANEPNEVRHTFNLQEARSMGTRSRALPHHVGRQRSRAMSYQVKLYAIFHTGNNPGKLMHKAYVTHVHPDRALEMYIQKHDADPNGLIALPISGNKFTFWRKKKKPNLHSRAEVLRSLDTRYTKAKLYELPLHR